MSRKKYGLKLKSIYDFSIIRVKLPDPSFDIEDATLILYYSRLDLITQR